MDATRSPIFNSIWNVFEFFKLLRTFQIFSNFSNFPIFSVFMFKFDEISSNPDMYCKENRTQTKDCKLIPVVISIAGDTVISRSG